MRIMKLLLIGLVFLASVSLSFAVPEIAYTNFARTTGGGLVLESTVDVRITIFNSGSKVFQEVFTAVPTNGYGLFTVKLGTGTPVSPYLPNVYDDLVAVNTLNVQAETNDGGGYRFVQLSPLLNTALKNEEAAGIVTLNDAYLNGETIEILDGTPIDLTGTGLIQSDATIAAINANGNKTLTTKEYVDNGIANVADNPFLVYQDASAELPNSKILNGEANVINFNATTATLSILNNGISEPKLKMANDPVNGYIIKWNGSDMTWVDPTVFTAAPVSGDGTAGNPITLDYNWPMFLNGINLDLEYDATLKVDPTNGLGIDLAHANSWTANQTFSSVDINGGTIDATVIGATTPAEGTFTTLVVNSTADIGTDLTVGGYATIGDYLDVAGNTTTNTLDVEVDATVGGDLDVAGNTTTNTLDVVSNATVGGDLDVTGTTTSALFVGQLDKEIVNGDGIALFMYDNTADATVAFDYNFYNEWFVTQTISPTADEPALIANNTGFFNKTSTTTTSFALQGYAQGQVATIPGFPTVAQGLTGIGEYTGAAPSTNMVIGTVGLTDPGIGIVAVGVYGGSREDNNVANVGTVGHAYNDAAGLQDMNHGVVGMVSLTPGANAEIAAALSLNLNSGVTGINLGANANDYAGYFIGKVNVTGNLASNSLNVTTTANVGTNLTVGGLTTTNTLDVTTDAVVGNDLAVVNDLGVGNDASVGGNLVVTGTTTSLLFIGETNFDIQDGAGIADFTFNNLGDAIVAVDYDATLEIDGSDKLGLDLDHENSWTVNQTFASVDINGGAIDNTIIGADVAALGYFTTVYASNDVIATDKVEGKYLSTTNYLNAAAGGVRIGEDDANLNGWLKFKNAGIDVIQMGETADDGQYGIRVNDNAGNFRTGLGWDETLNTWGIGTGDGTDFAGLNFTTNNTVDEARIIVLDGGMPAFLVDAEGDVTANTYTGELVNKLTDGAGIVDFTYDNLGNAVVSVDYDATLKIDGADKLGLDLAHSNEWTALQTFRDLTSSNDIATPIVDIYGAVSITGEAGNADFLTFENVDFLLDGDAVIAGATYFMDNVSIDLNLDVTGDVTANTYTGELVNKLEDGAGIADFTYNNLGAAIVAVDYDATLNIDGTDKLGIDLAHSNTWTADQLLNATAAQGNNLIAAINLGTANTLFGDVVKHDNTLKVTASNELALNENAPFNFTNIIAFNPVSGPAATFTSTDATAPTVTIENTDPSGVALELVGSSEETTALEITTGGLNIGAGQFIVSSNSGLTGVEPNGPSITINNNGDGVSENGGALEILLGHTAFSYTQVADQADLSDLPYTVIEITLTADLTVTNLPGFDFGAEKHGTIIYIVNPDNVDVITLPGTLGTIGPKAAAQLVYTAAGWIRIN